MSVAHSPTRATALSPADAADAAVWRVRLLGGFEIDDGRHRLTRLRSRAAMALLAQLALAPERDHAREVLVGLLWPDADEVAGRNRLRQTLSLLKAVLEPAGGPPVLQADRRVVRAVPGALWCDARAFEQAHRAGRHADAAALYGGELLPGFYDEWVLDERGRLQALRERLADQAPTPSASPERPAPPAPFTSAAVPTRSAVPRLPQYLTRLIGADVQGARLQALVFEHRLVTVLGAGGCGKTRLATEVARLACTPPPGGPAPQFEHAVFVSLVGASTATELLDRLQAALRIEAAGPPLDSVLATLEGRPLLMVLDNAEQLHDEAAAAIAHLAERLPPVHWLVTSRRPLGLDGERSFALETLELPAPEAPLDAVVLNPAVALFIDRARAHRAEFHVSAGNRSALVALVRWLDGLPLAIELAASHARTLGPAELLALLQAARADRSAPAGSLAFLARRGVRSGSDPRHASMLGVVEWSWRLLTAPQQQMLAALCLLPVGAALPMAAALGGEMTVKVMGTDAPLSLAQAQSLLDDLVSSSVLKTPLGQDGQRRYLPLEPVREYVLAQLSDGAQHTQRQRLLAWLMDWAQHMPATAPLPSVRDELPNLVQALVAAPADGRANDALRLVLWLQSSWGEIAVPAGALDALDTLLSGPGLDTAHAAAGHALAATFCYEAGRTERVRHHLALAESLPCPDPVLRVMVLSRTARLHWRLDRNTLLARARIEEALPLARATGRSNTEASLLSLKGHMLTAADGLPEQGRTYTEQSLALWQRSGNRHLINAGRYNVAVTALRAGRPATVLTELAALADEGRELQDWDLASGALEAHGTALLALRRWPEAACSLRASLALAWDGMEMMAVMYALWNFAPVLARLRLAELAAMTMAAADAHWRERYGQRDASELRELRRVRRFSRTLLGPAAAQAAWARGAARSVGDTVRAVLASPAGR